MIDEARTPHPFRTVRRLLRRIPNPRLRMLVIFLVFFGINLVAGRVVETLFDKERLTTAYAAQEAWITKLRAFTPLEIGKGYLADFGPAMRGEIFYRSPPPLAAVPVPEAVTRALQEDADWRLACIAARAGMPDRSCTQLLPAGESASTCTASPSTPGCSAFLSCQADERAMLFFSPPECSGIGSSSLLTPSLGTGLPVAGAPSLAAGAPEKRAVVPGILAPVAALVRTATRLFSGGAAAIVPIMQLGFGILGAVVVMRDRRKQPVDGDSFAMLLMSPVVVILIASLGALALKWLMIGALASLSWVTHFAAGAAGATGFLGACWYCFSKLAEKGVEGALTGKMI